MDRRSDYLYHLPDELIAQAAVEPRDSSRLLVLDKTSGETAHRTFHDLPELLREDDTLVFNDTRVIPARLHGQRSSGGQVELLLLEETENGVWDCLARPAKKLKSDTSVRFSEDWSARVLTEGEAGRRTVRFEPPNDAPYNSTDFLHWLERHGSVPLPPYIHRDPGEADRDRYQTVYAEHPGSVAAPTAGLHFTDSLLARLSERGIGTVRLTLHVGIGTFRPVEVENLIDHKMDEERYEVSPDAASSLNATRQRGGRIVAVGTTSVRTLESVTDDSGVVHPGTGRTALFIRPPYEFKAVDALVTNFHLPGSTLLMLVSSLAGYSAILSAYEEAVRERYRFFSYGDAMLIA